VRPRVPCPVCLKSAAHLSDLHHHIRSTNATSSRMKSAQRSIARDAASTETLSSRAGTRYVRGRTSHIKQFINFFLFSARDPVARRSRACGPTFARRPHYNKVHAGGQGARCTRVAPTLPVTCRSQPRRHRQRSARHERAAAPSRPAACSATDAAADATTSAAPTSSAPAHPTTPPNARPRPTRCN